MKTLNIRVQSLVSIMQDYKRNLDECKPTPTATQHWMCPACTTHHFKEPINLVTYRCDYGWTGDRDALLLGDTSCLTTT